MRWEDAFFFPFIYIGVNLFFYECANGLAKQIMFFCEIHGILLDGLRTQNFDESIISFSGRPQGFQDDRKGFRTTARVVPTIYALVIGRPQGSSLLYTPSIHQTFLYV